MTASVYDSPAWRGLFHDPELSPLFTDTAELRATLLVMGTLALTQAKAGIVPDVSAQAIQRASMEVQIDPAALAKVTSETGDPVLATVAQFKSEMQAPEHAKWVHYDSETTLTAATGLSLRLRQSFKIIGARLGADDTPQVAAYHADADIRAGLAKGLGLSDGSATSPETAIRDIAGWITQQAQDQEPQTTVDQAIQHQIGHLNAAIQSAPDDTSTLINMMTLPQMVLGLGRLLN